MALQITVQTDAGITATNAYARIDTVAGSKDKLDISLNYYVNQQAFIDEKAHVKQEYYSFVPSVEEGAENFIQQGYEHLKTLPEFADAVDC